MLPRHGVTIAINKPGVVLHANFGFRRTRAFLSHDQAASAPASSGFVKRCLRPEASLAMSLRLDQVRLFRLIVPTHPFSEPPSPE